MVKTLVSVVALLIAAAPQVSAQVSAPASRTVPRTGGGHRSVSFGEIVVTVEPVPGGNATHGYTEYVANILNRSGSPHRVTLTIPGQNQNTRGEYIQSITCTKDVGAGATVRMALLQPYRPVVGGDDIRVRIDGRDAEGLVPLSVQDNRTSSSSSRPGRMAAPTAVAGRTMPPGSRVFVVPPGVGENYVLRSHGSPRDFAEEVHRIGSTSFGVNENQFPGHAGPVSEWSTHWLAYSRYDGIVLTGGELRQMPEPVRTAIWQYVEAGGSLAILGGGDVPESWKVKESGGTGLTIYYPGFGRCLVSETANVAKWPDSARHDLIESWSETAAPWRGDRSAGRANQEFPVVEDVGVPIRGLFLLMVGFVAVIGPVNLMVLSRKRRRIWLLWTVPVISLVTCAAVFGYMLVSEGWNAHARAETITILDENSRRASTIGWVGYYSPLTPSGGLHFSSDTELGAQLTDDYWSARQSVGTARTLDWTTDQHMASGWVTARTPGQFMVRKSEPRRERVELTRNDAGTFTIVNGLGADITRFLYADDTGQVHGVGPVPAGSQATLKPVEKLSGREIAPSQMRLFYSVGLQSAGLEKGELIPGDWLKCMDRVTKSPKALLQPGRYVALLDSSPFIEDGLKARHRQAQAIVVGIPREARDAN